MSKSNKDTKKSRGRPKSTGSGKQLQLRLHDPLLKAIDDWADKFAPGEELTRQETIRRMLLEYLRHCGLIK